MHETILLVDDEPSIRPLMSNALQHAGYRVLEARNGAEATKVFNAAGASVDLLITDMRMPKLGGAELIAALRKKRQTLKVLRITGYAGNVPEKWAEPTLYKPFSRDELLAKIREALG